MVLYAAGSARFPQKREMKYLMNRFLVLMTHLLSAVNCRIKVNSLILFFFSVAYLIYNCSSLSRMLFQYVLSWNCLFFFLQTEPHFVAQVMSPPEAAFQVLASGGCSVKGCWPSYCESHCKGVDEEKQKQAGLPVCFSILYIGYMF